MKDFHTTEKEMEDVHTTEKRWRTFTQQREMENRQTTEG
jgi:hypothetical protein